MNGIHDMGGMHGFGPIVREADEPRFHAAWEARVLAMDRLVLEQGYFTRDAHRYGIERMTPADYLRASYYERWLASFEFLLMQQGLLTGDELNARIDLLRRHPDLAPQQGAPPAPPPAPRARSEPTTPPPAPRFAVGDAVMAHNVHPTGHTRLPRYVRGKQGVINFVYEPELLPDANAHGLGEHPQVVYNVRFDGRELWGDSAEPRQTVSIDLWECYLGPASR